MKNPRFEDSAISPLRFPEPDKIACKDCMYRAKDIGSGKDAVDGAALGTCDAYAVKPPSILFDGAECKYYLKNQRAQGKGLQISDVKKHK